MKRLEAKDYRRAWVEFLNAIKGDPNFLEAHYRLGVAAMAVKEPRAAYRALATAEKLDEGKQPYSVDIRLRLGLLLLESRNYEEVQEKAQWVLTRDPQNAPARELLAFALVALAQPGDVSRQLDLLLAQQPKNLQARWLRASVHMDQAQMEEARRILEEGVQITERSVQAVLSLGNYYILAGKADQAEPLFQEVLRKDPAHVEARLALGWLYAYLGRRGEAEAAFRAAGAQRPHDPDVAGALANFYVHNGELTAATQELERLTATDKSPVLLNRLAVLYHVEGRTDDAQRLAQAILKDNPQDVRARLLSGVLLLESGGARQAANDFADLAASRSELAVAHYFLGLASLATQTEAKARVNFADALKADRAFAPARVWLVRLQLLAGASRSALAALDEAPPAQREMAEFRMLRVLERLDSAQSAAAVEDLRAALQKDPQIVLQYYQTGFRPLLNRNSALMRQAAEAALHSQPGSPPVLMVLAHSLVAEGKIGQAVARLQAEVQKRPASVALLLLLGDLQGKDRRFDAARGTLAEAARLAPLSPDPDLLRAQVEVAAGRLSTAKELAESLTRRFPRDAAIWTRLGMIEEMLANFPAATRAYERALALDPLNAIAANNLAWRLSADHDDFTRALPLVQRARELEPQNPAFADTLGWIYFRIGSWHFALKEFENAVRWDPANGSYRYRLGLAQARSGRDDDALATLADAAKLDPGLAQDAELRRVVAEIQQRKAEAEARAKRARRMMKR
jgi:tetratricopeptide (TPR) repeat protein